MTDSPLSHRLASLALLGLLLVSAARAAQPDPAAATASPVVASGAAVPARPLPVSTATQLADTRAPSASAAHRPRICVALSGGGARGYAHIGVLRELERLHVPVDCIAGTSMGAVIGGLYASGMSADQIEHALSANNLNDVAFDRDPREDWPQSVRDDNLAYPVGMPVGFGNGQLKMPNGFVQGNKLTALLRANTGQIPSDVDFDRLPIPYRAVATDLETGDRVVLSHGSLPQAIRASMAVPGLFAPVKIDGRTLIDGGAVSNLPIDIARQMGADIVIAVDIGTPLNRADQITSMAGVTSQMMRLMMNRNVLEQKATLRPTDVLLEPDLGDLSFSDFGAMDQGVAAGTASAQAHSQQLAALSIAGTQYAAYRAGLSHETFLPPGTRIDRIEIATHGNVPASRVRAALHAQPGDVYDPAAIDHSLGILVSADDFESVSHSFTGPPGDRVLSVDASAKSWGPNLLLFGLALSTNFDGDGAFALQIGHRLPWITESGLSWRNDIVLGSRDLGWRTELRQPVFGDVYVAPYAGIRRNDINLYSDDVTNSEPIAKYVQQDVRAGIDIGVPLGNWGEVRAGVAQVWTSYKARSSILAMTDNGNGDWSFGTTQVTPESTSQAVGNVGIKIDQLDDPLFPRHGFYLDSNVQVSLTQSDGSYNLAHARGLWAASHGIFSVNAAIEVGGKFGADRGAPTYVFNLGGFQRLSAYAQDQFSGDYILYGRTTGFAQLSKADTGPLRGVFAGASLEAGNVWTWSRQFARGPWLTSASVFVGSTTMIGPVYLGFAMAPRGIYNVYFQLGNRF
ncbi:patatin-like phospholipase family protein [Paraburkholderia silviterrae]|uniref:Patatin n=1 Tax=Paraburkholderia silviterrae TaxID=2528715 RepID=A0A4R5M1W7_9BURK|nr:patatin-like phospholipase family protein [Paraburkholderia silviterrae]TDG19388.1 patatin [Paraburkholderia silviterrae]